MKLSIYYITGKERLMQSLNVKNFEENSGQFFWWSQDKEEFLMTQKVENLQKKWEEKNSIKP